jgi:hypothetical protein
MLQPWPIAKAYSSTIVLPVPIDLIRPLLQSVEVGADRRAQAERRRQARKHERELDAEERRELPEAGAGRDLPRAEEDDSTG